jgi:hypothetical protein
VSLFGLLQLAADVPVVRVDPKTAGPSLVQRVMSGLEVYLTAA